MEPEINAIIQSRLKKLEILNEKGIDPYPTDFKPSHSTIDCLQLLEEIEKKELEKSDEILSAGRITALRKMGKAIFIDILDEQGKIQLLARDNTIDAAPINKPRNETIFIIPPSNKFREIKNLLATKKIIFISF